ncbi:hypothetical protein GCM10007940_14650 [Portibacter lacus]|uniref:Cytochrome C Planctomycete-type domain-containing protein n=2 Tax=Portibacter lacus TaxID=1099794 RepID=A0AA37SRV1_9BACT|nr:hypothetical protein GCM10007940_14650 [Portibacter lacus]
MVFIFSCTRDTISEVESECLEVITYTDHIQPLVNGTCAYTGCHVGSSAPGNFTTYDGLAKFFDNDLIEREVIRDRTMPPNSSTLGPTELSDEELELFKCWIQAGYPKN